MLKNYQFKGDGHSSKTAISLAGLSLQWGKVLQNDIAGYWGTSIRGLMRGMATLHQGNHELLVVRHKVGRPPGEPGVSKSSPWNVIFFPSVLWHCWLGGRKGIRPVKKLDVGLLVVMIWLKLCTTYSSSSPVVTTTSIILCFNKHRLTLVHLENGR